MEYAPYRSIDRRQWTNTLFYVDLVVIAVFGLALVFLVVHAYHAGFYYTAEQFADNNNALWKVVTDASFLVASLAWIFFRFFRNQYLATRRGAF